MTGPLEGLPGGAPTPERQIVVSKETKFHDFAIASVDPLPDGGQQVTFVVLRTGELFVFPIARDAAEKLGKALIAPRVALPDGNGGGLHSVP